MKKWWQRIIAYEIYVNSFQDSDGDGYGDICGIRSRLDYLRDLGVGAIWLTPVYDSPMVDNGYDVADYYQISPRYGTIADMEALIAEAADRGIRVVMDLVFNHTSDQCEWFVESCKSKNNEYSDWYIWRDAKPDGSAPNNWRGIFGGPAWTWSESRQQYYLHTFAEAQPDLNWANPKVREALYAVADFWLKKGVGGFRMDAIPYIKKPADLSDGPADDADGMVSIHTMTANTPGILDYLHEFKDKVLAGRDIFTVGEASGVGPGDLINWVGESGVFDMIFEFSHMNLEFEGAEIWCKAGSWTLTDLKKALTASQAATADNGWYPIYFENHDKPRSINHYFGDEADPVLAGRAIGTVLLTLRGTPFVYQGQELGLTNVRWPSIDYYNDLNSYSQYQIALQNGLSAEEAMECVYRFSRDNARTPMQWSAEANAGFTTGTPWLPVKEDYAAVNAESEREDGDAGGAPGKGSVLSWYKKLISFRAEHPVLIDGRYSEVFGDSERIYAYVRGEAPGKGSETTSSGCPGAVPGEQLLVIVNFSNTEEDYDLAGVGFAGVTDRDILLSSYSGYSGTEQGKGKDSGIGKGSGIGSDKGNGKGKDSEHAPAVGHLRPYEAVVIKLH